jgi:cysteine desulfurase
VLLAPMIDGGGHERGMRSGTLNVPGIVGFGKAAELCRLEMAADAERLSALRERLNKRLQDAVEAAIIGRRDIQAALDDAAAFWNSKLSK